MDERDKARECGKCEEEEGVDERDERDKARERGKYEEKKGLDERDKVSK